MQTWQRNLLGSDHGPRTRARAVRERLAEVAVHKAEELAALRRRAGHQPAPHPGICHVVFLGWKRCDYALRTLEAFTNWNQGCGFRLWYGTDGECDPRMPPLAEAFGFVPLLKSEAHRGIAKMVDGLVGRLTAQVDPSGLCLLLEEDWECCRAIPMQTVRRLLAAPSTGWVRLVGRARQRAADGFADPYRIGPWPNERWERQTVDGEPLLIGPSRWAHLPHIVKLQALLGFVKGSRNERTSITWSAASGLKCAWLLRNAFWHIGSLRSVRSLGGRE